MSAKAREVTQDARHTLRLWARRPWPTAFAILALAIGIGANTGVFSKNGPGGMQRMEAF